MAAHGKLDAEAGRGVTSFARVVGSPSLRPQEVRMGFLFRRD
jgi:hypothetical protein